MSRDETEALRADTRHRFRHRRPIAFVPGVPGDSRWLVSPTPAP